MTALTNATQEPSCNAVNPALDEFKAFFGPQLTALRQRHGYTTSVLAKETAMPCHYIERLEAGLVVPRIETLLALAKALDVSVKKFFP